MRPDEFPVTGGEVRELTPTEIEAAIAEDPELFLITDYLMGSLAPDEARAVEARLRDDAAFHERVGIIVEAWHAWPTARDFALPEEELVAASRRFRREGERLLGAGDDAAGRRDGAARPGAGNTPREASIRQMQRRLRRWQLAAGFLGAILLPAAVWSGVRLAAPAPRPEVHMVQPGGREGVPVRIGEHALALVEAGGRFVWNDSANSNGIRELFLEGEAQFQMRRAPVGQYVVVTPSARIIVSGSDFQVTAVDPSVTTVRVLDGTVVLGSRGVRDLPLLPLGAGERGVAIWRQEPRRVY